MVRKIDTAMLLAAGIGSRMQGVIDYPKSMIKLGKKTLIEHILEDLYNNNIIRVVINLHYKADLLMKHIRSLPIFSNFEINFSIEKELLETAGAVKKALPIIDREEFFVINTDCFFEDTTITRFSSLQNSWDNNKKQLLLLTPISNTIGYNYNGDFNLNKNNLLIRPQDKKRDYVYTGTQIIRSSLLDSVKNNKKISFANIWHDMQNDNGEIDGIYGVVFKKGKWLHLGDPAAKNAAQNYFN